MAAEVNGQRTPSSSGMGWPEKVQAVAEPSNQRIPSSSGLDSPEAVQTVLEPEDQRTSSKMDWPEINSKEKRQKSSTEESEVPGVAIVKLEKGNCWW